MDRIGRSRIIIVSVFLVISIGLYGFYLALNEVKVVYVDQAPQGNSSGKEAYIITGEYTGDSGKYNQKDVFKISTADIPSYEKGDVLYIYFFGKPDEVDGAYHVKAIHISKSKQ